MALGEDGLRQGVVVTAYSGYYEVAINGRRVVTAQPRGRLKRLSDGIVTGDRVTVRTLKDGRARIEDVLPRRNRLLRPPVANIDQVLLVFSLCEPPWNRELTDRILVLSEAAGIDSVLCINKTTLAPREEVDAAAERYERIGYRVLKTDAIAGSGLDALRACLAGRVTVLAGESGVGKSSLLNALEPSLALPTGALNERYSRGKHTTRKVSLLRLASLEPEGYVADAPGFSALDVKTIDRHQLGAYFREFREPMQACRFDDCLHRAEPGCGVKRAVERGAIDPQRYSHYLRFLSEIEEHLENLYR